MKLFCVLLAIHIFGGIMMILYHCKDGTMEDAAKYGDGIRSSEPVDIVFFDLVIWEILFIVYVIEWIANVINKYFGDKFGD